MKKLCVENISRVLRLSDPCKICGTTLRSFTKGELIDMLHKRHPSVMSIPGHVSDTVYHCLWCGAAFTTDGRRVI